MFQAKVLNSAKNLAKLHNKTNLAQIDRWRLKLVGIFFLLSQLTREF